MKVLSYGSLNIDYVYRMDHFVRKGETLDSKDRSIYAGGKGLNQSIALARARMPVWHAGAVGKEGTFLLDTLKEAGADVSLTEVLEDIPTGHAIIQNDAEGDNCIILFAGANKAIAPEDARKVITGFGEQDLLVLSNEISSIAELMKMAKDKGMQIAFTPAPMNEAVRTYPVELCDWLLLNETEAAGLLGETEEKTAEGLARALAEKYPETGIVLTLGSKGSLGIKAKEIIRQPIYAVETVDTTAAGDTFAGYFLAGILSGKDMKESMDMAAKAAAIACSRSGAAPSIPTMEEVISFQNEK